MHPCNDTLPLGHVDLPEFDAAIAALDVDWRASGYYDPSVSRLVSLLLFAAALVGFSVRLRRHPLLSGVFMGLAILVHFRHAHECGHEKGFHRPEVWPSARSHRLAMYAIINLGSGIDGPVWQTEHRLHHAHTLTDRDPQISAAPGAVMPLFSAHEAPLATFIAEHPLASALLVRWQEVTYLPLLLLVGKYFLGAISYGAITREGYPKQDALLRKTTLVGHYLLLFASAVKLAGSRSGNSKSEERRSMLRRIRGVALWLLGCSLASGMVEPMFLFNHIQTGASKHLDAGDKVAQLCHTVNYRLRMPRFLPLDEYLIPVSYHIEHHLAPKMPDENLHRIAGDVERVATQSGVPYRSKNMEDIIWEYTVRLAAVPRDRWGGMGGCVAPLAMVVILVAVVRWCGGSIWQKALLRQRARTKMM